MYITFKMDTTSAGALILLVATVGYYLHSRQKRLTWTNAPPCLPSLPVIGSLPFLGGGLDKLHICLTNLAKKHGNVYGLYVGSKYHIVLSGYSMIREALMKNAAAYAGRGKIIIDGIIWIDPGRGLVFHDYDSVYQESRQAAISALKTLGMGIKSQTEARIQIETTHLVEYIKSLNGKAWYLAETFEAVTLNVIYSVMFGDRLEYGSDLSHFLTTSVKAMADSADALYDVFPLLMSIPPYKAKVHHHTEVYRKWLEFLEGRVRDKLSGDQQDEEDNFISEFVKNIGRQKVSERELAVIIRDLTAAGTETTSGQLTWALIFLANNPEVQSRVQKEIDSVVERGRLPSLDYKPKLPYLEATILEVMRMRTALPLLLPHLTLCETQLAEFKIPEKTGVLINAWSAHMSPDDWTVPEVFNPERFLDANGEVIKRDMILSFSLGKRSCLGEFMARQELFLFLSSIVQHFNILPPEGEVKVKDEMCFLRAALHLVRLLPR